MRVGHVRRLLPVLPIVVVASVLVAATTPAQDPGESHPWVLQERKHWQIASPGAEAKEVTDAALGGRGRCLPGMVDVSGSMKVNGWGYEDGIDTLQEGTCVDWIQKAYPDRCERFDRNVWLERFRPLATQTMRFCIDRYEYPNQRLAYPWIMVTWTEATALCAREGERLCSEAEWTFACEGPEALPYPYGYERDSTACVSDRPWRNVDPAALSPRDSPHARAEIDRLWQGEASGSRARCKSPFGIYDLVGNVDEWTVSVVRGERPSILKGGYWGRVRDRCRPSTRAHGEDFAFYQQGFRCCADEPAAAPSR